jgi:hypothetical protein
MLNFAEQTCSGAVILVLILGGILILSATSRGDKNIVWLPLFYPSFVSTSLHQSYLMSTVSLKPHKELLQE